MTGDPHFTTSDFSLVKYVLVIEWYISHVFLSCRERRTGDVYRTVLSVVFVSASSYLHNALHMASLALAFYICGVGNSI